MACETITDIVVRESGRYMPDAIRSRSFPRSPWMSLVPRDTWPDEMGTTISNLTYERSAPLEAEPGWSAMTVQDGAEAGGCLPPVTKVGIGSTTRSFTLYWKALEGPDFCAENLRYSFALSRQLNKIANILSAYTVIEWDIRFRHEYFRAVKRHVVVTNQCPGTSSFAEGETAYPATCPQAKLSLGILDNYKMDWLRDGGNETALGYEDGMPVPTIILSWETFEGLKRDNTDRREDLRYGAPNKLLTPFGVVGSLWGYYFIVDPYPRRFTCTGGVYTEVPAFVDGAASKGRKSEVNQNWKDAPYEETVWFDRGVMTVLHPNPISNPAERFSFNPSNYTGDWKVMNIKDRHCNPDGKIIYHRGILAHAVEPVNPERGMTFVHLRCPPPCEIKTICTS